MLNPFRDQKLLEGIQGNILKAHGRHYTANVFIHCNDGQKNEAKAWLKSLVEGEDAIIQSGYVQVRTNLLWKEQGIDAGLFACIQISATGYDYLTGQDTSHALGDASFQNGMKKADLNDPASETWEDGFKEDSHFMLLLAHNVPNVLAKAVVDILEDTQSFAKITTIENGAALINREGAGIEHFGYVDGVSQPLFFEDELDTYKKDNNIEGNTPAQFDPSAEKELVLVPDPFVDNDPNAMGSYFVFRKLEQNVRGFKQAEDELADLLGLIGEDTERAGAMLVGRFEDGTPVQLNEEAGLIHSAVLNNFDYDFADASKCPFHAHIRKVNPRSALTSGNSSMLETKKRIMARRGIPFGTRADDPNDGQIVNKPIGGVGLLFMSYQASIIEQFEFIQKNWANTPASAHLPPDAPDGVDPVIGQGEPRLAGIFATKWGQSGNVKQVGFDQFVHMKGGEYFFAPSMSFLKTIDIILIS